MSTKNITFAKGLARKLVPKYIGPYKIIQDYNNQSFKLELLVHLKRRGVHDVFHSSLLRIHLPNDDRLFPGRMDTQLGDGPDTEDEWAVELIRSHAGSGENSIFEIVWKSGDITWMPLYQIKHLQAFETYLELMGVDQASALPTGAGKPPQQDPQIFIGALSITSSSTTFPAPFRRPMQTTPFSPPLSDIFDDSFVFYPSHPFDLDTTREVRYLTLAYPDTVTPNYFNPPIDIMSRSIQHQRITRLSKTEYIIINPNSKYRWRLHTGQIMTFLTFDKALREGKNPAASGIPLGYSEFAAAFNAGTHPNDHRYLSTFHTTSSGDQIIPSTNPVCLEDL